MATPDRYRAFARKCVQWAEKAKDIKHREILLDMAAHWAETTVQIECQHSLLDEFNSIIVTAQSSLAQAREAGKDGGPDKRQFDGARALPALKEQAAQRL
jgi:hypothetical protein